MGTEVSVAFSAAHDNNFFLQKKDNDFILPVTESSYVFFKIIVKFS